MPISLKDFAEVVRRIPPDQRNPETIDKAVEAHQGGTTLDKIWSTVNRPIAGSSDALIPALRHEHGADESGLRKGVEDVAATFTSPVSLATGALAKGAQVAGAAGKLGISNAARVGEAALQVPFAAEGVKNAFEGETPGAKIGGVIEAGLAGHGIKNAAVHPIGQVEHALPAAVEQKAELLAQPKASELVRGVEGVSTPHNGPSVEAPATGKGPQPLHTLSDELAAQINASHQNGGSTTSLLNQRLLGEGDGRFMLSPYSDRTQILEHPPTPQDLRNYAAKNEDLLSQPGHNLGTWWNKEGDNKHYLDVSITENDPQKAFDLARKHNQLAVYDMHEGKDVPILGAPQPKSGIDPSKILAVAAPAASAAIDDSDPNDPNQQLKRYGKFALDLGGAAGMLGMAAKRGNAIPVAKDAAARGAALMMLGNGKRELAKHIVGMGIEKSEVPKVLAASQKILDTQATKVGQKLTSTKQLLSYFDAGKGDLDWYNTQKELTHYFGEDASVVSHLIAATSNNSTVKANLTLALKAYAQHKANPEAPIEGLMKTLLPAVDRARAGQELGGRKVENFARALMGDPNAVVVDRWMMRAAGFKGDVPTATQYDVIEHMVREIAKQNGVEPRQVQAAMWFGAKSALEKPVPGKPRRPASPPYGQVLKDKFGSVEPSQVIPLLQQAVDSWKAGGKAGDGSKSFPNALQKAIKGAQTPSLPFK